ncbi:MAG: D-alanyl-D-alanine carboxypeptidase family protein, partial [Aurantimonas coralicida]
MLLTGAGHAEANAKYAGFVIDANNGQVLYNDRADEYRYPASLTKMMTLYMTFDALKSGRISMKDKMPVSAYAAGRPPSKIGLKTGSTLTVEEAVYSLVTKSANDAAVVLGEFQAGSESAFAARMTAKARQIGMPKTTFRNANGLPDSGQKTTARDMATLGIALREHFPEYYKIFSTRSYSFRGRRLGNHNRV